MTGFAGGPGVSTFYCLDPATFVIALRAFYGSIPQVFPNDVTITVEGSGDVINDATGALTGSWITAEAAGTVGGDAGLYAAPAGAAIGWLTSTVVDGSRLAGRTFLVPLCAAAYQNEGSIGDDTLASLRAAAAVLVGATPGNFMVWHRPQFSETIPRVVTRPGSSAAVTGSRVNDRVAILRSRRP